jgi:hypothetical protein
MSLPPLLPALASWAGEREEAGLSFGTSAKQAPVPAVEDSQVLAGQGLDFQTCMQGKELGQQN